MLPILQLIRAPESVRSWGTRPWADTLPRLQQCGLTAHAAVLVARAGLGRDDVPEGVRRQFLATSLDSDAQLRTLRWELGEVVRALSGRGIRAVPLKGADYLLRNGTPSLGRTVADLDILVAKADVAATTEALQLAGWGIGGEAVQEGNHQLPGFVHSERSTQLELHFQVVAEGGAVTFDVGQVISGAALQPDGVLAILQPADTVLVRTAHFIRNSRTTAAFRDLLDLRELVADFTATDPDFGATLIARAERVGLGAALSRAVRDSTTLFGPLAAAELNSWARRRRPSLGGGSALALIPDGATLPSFGVRLSRVGRMFARMRSAYPPGKTLQVGWQVLFGSEAKDA
ncbi:MAG: nucleotidyltransferase family protein [Gemmatimonadota bacterium]